MSKQEFKKLEGSSKEKYHKGNPHNSHKLPKIDGKA